MKLDDFESVFRSSIKAQFQHEPPVLERALLVTDLDEKNTKLALAAAKAFLGDSHVEKLGTITTS